MQNLLKMFMFFIFLSTLVFSDFGLKNMDVNLYVEEDGSGHVIETITLYVDGEESMQTYSDYLSYGSNDIVDWQGVLGVSDLRYHIGGSNVIIEDLVITAGPFYSLNDYAKTALVDIRLDYNVKGPIDDDPTTDLFYVEQIKPRTKQYTFNKKSLLFEQDSGDVILPPLTKFKIILPSNVLITNVKPIPVNFEGTVPYYDQSTLEWKTVRLTEFTLIYEKEESLESEIVKFFDDFVQNIVILLRGPEGIAIILLVITLVVTLVYLQKVKQK